MEQQCFKCGKKKISIKKYILHVNFFHKNELFFYCNICEPYRKFNSLNSFQKHTKKHNDDQKLNIQKKNKEEK